MPTPAEASLRDAQGPPVSGNNASQGPGVQAGFLAKRTPYLRSWGCGSPDLAAFLPDLAIRQERRQEWAAVSRLQGPNWSSTTNPTRATTAYSINTRRVTRP